MQEMQETRVRSLGGEDHLVEEMATHSSILAWRIQRTEEPGGLQSMGSWSHTRLSNGASARACTFHVYHFSVWVFRFFQFFDYC